MQHSLRLNQATLAATLLDFLLRTVEEFGAGVSGLRERLKAGVTCSLGQIMEKRVVSSFSQIFENARLERELRERLAEGFPEFCSGAAAGTFKDSGNTPIYSILDITSQNGYGGKEGGSALFSDSDVEVIPRDEDEPVVILSHRNGGTSSAGLDGDFSDDEVTEITESENDYRANSNNRSGSLRNSGKRPNSSDLNAEQLLPVLRTILDELKTAEGNYNQCDVVQKLLLALLQQDDLSEEQASLVADALCDFFGSDYFAQVMFPADVADIAALEESVARPINVIFRNWCLLPDRDPTYEPLLLLLSLMYERQPRLGYHFLYFLKVSRSLKQDVKMSNYSDLSSRCDMTLEMALVRDLTLCQEDDYRVFGYLIPDVYIKFESVAVGSVDLMHLVVGTVDSIQMQDLVSLIMQGNMRMFRKDTFSNLLNTSLSWETIEQYFMWQLIAADDIQFEWLMPVISKLTYPDDAEALTNVLLLLKRMDFTVNARLVRALFSRQLGQTNDFFTSSAIKLLFENDEDRMVDVLASILSKSVALEQQAARSANVKRSGGARGPLLDQVLGHLDILRQQWPSSQNLFLKEAIQNALKEAQRSSSESIKNKYSELFIVLEVLDSVRSGRSLRRGRKIEPAPLQEDTESSEEERQKPTRKRQKIAVDSDSD